MAVGYVGTYIRMCIGLLAAQFYGNAFCEPITAHFQIGFYHKMILFLALRLIKQGSTQIPITIWKDALDL
jgi:hypothetical protein